MEKLLALYERLSHLEKLLLQILAFRTVPCDFRQLCDIAKSIGFRRDDGKQLTQTQVRDCLAKLFAEKLVSRLEVVPVIEIRDYLIREGLSSSYSESLRELASKQSRWGSKCETLDFYIAFYCQDGNRLCEVSAKLVPGSIPLLSPFSQQTFDSLSLDRQLFYFDFVIPGWVNNANADPEAVKNLELMLARQETGESFLPARVSWAIVTGNIAALRELSSLGRTAQSDVEGVLKLLTGDTERGFQQLATCVTRRKANQSLTQLGGLPTVFALLGAFHPASKLSLEQALQATIAVNRSPLSPYATAFELIRSAMEYSIKPTGADQLLKCLTLIPHKPFDRLIAGLLLKWLDANGGESCSIPGLQTAGKQFESIGCLWLAAEAYALARHNPLETSNELETKANQLHRELGTSSLMDQIKPAPPWAQTLAAIARLAESLSPSSTSAVGGESASDRMIYEIHSSKHHFFLEAFHQVRKGNQWSKGRKVALTRLHHQYQEAEFAFMTPEDRALCQTLRHWTERNSYGYPDEYCEFDQRLGARALIGHPRIYLPGEREHPLEFTESPVRLLVRKDPSGMVELSLHPKPLDSRELLIEELGVHQRGVTLFDPQHLVLQAMIGDGLKVPAEAADQVMNAIAGLASLVTIHSEIGSNTQSVSARSDSAKADKQDVDTDTPMPMANRVLGDTRPHLRLRPSGDGFRVELRVHPLGDAGPSCIPGEGATTLMATVDRNAVMTDRDLHAELERANSVLSHVPILAQFMLEGWAGVLPSPLEALQLVEEIESLASAGEVILHWPKGKALQLAGKATESMLRVSVRRDRDWFAATGKLKVNQELTIDMMDLIKLVAESPSRFVQLNDGRFLALAENLRARIRDLRFFGDGRSVKNKLRFASAHASFLEDLGEVKVTADAHWKNCTERMKSADKLTLRIPRTLQAELRDYQREGVFWLMRLAAWGVGGCLADDMGLGKTVQAIALLLERSAQGPSAIVAPTSVIYNWQDELNRFAPTLVPHVLADSDRVELLKSLGAGDVLLCSYGLLQTQAKAMSDIDFVTLILDEAQAIKNSTTKRSHTAKSLSAQCRVILTGTPMENHLGELWNLMDFINPGLLGSEESFQERFAIPIERDGDHVARSQLRRLISPFILRRTKAQVLRELPPRTETTLRINPSCEEAAFYEAVRHRAIEAIEANTEEQPTHLRVLAEIMRLRRACCHPKLVVPESEITASKLSTLMDLLADLHVGNHRALIFSQFVDLLAIVREALDAHKIEYQYLDGSTPAATRKKSVEAFQSGHGDVFLISLKAGGTGLNLTAADYVIHLDPWWNPAVEDQASDRAHRLGQHRPVTIYRMILAGTIEERILALHATKRDLADSLLEGTDRSGKLSTEDLLQLIRS